MFVCTKQIILLYISGIILYKSAAEGGVQDADRVGRQPEVRGSRPTAGLPGATVPRQTCRHQETYKGNQSIILRKAHLITIELRASRDRKTVKLNKLNDYSMITIQWSYPSN